MFKAITTVYSYRFPEVRKAIDKKFESGFPHGVIMGGTNPPGALDNFHQPIVQRVLQFYKSSVPALEQFQHKYPTPASEEGIREAMTFLQCKGVQKIYVLPGEYEGYSFVGETRNIKAITVDPENGLPGLEPGYWFISNPFAGSGNILPDSLIKRICDAGHKVFYDFAYLGSTQEHVFDLSHPNIFAAVVSFSKPFGLFYDRAGFAFSREPIPALFGNKWFKSILALMIADGVVADLKPQQLYDKYRPVQEQIIADINAEFNLGMKPSDALLLGHITAEDALKLGTEQLAMIEPFKRGAGYRFCLTPYYFEIDPERNELFAEWYAYVKSQPEDMLSPKQMEGLGALAEEWGVGR